MATIFVSAVDGLNTDNGTTWALAKQTVQGALSIASVGDVIVVDNAGTFSSGVTFSWTCLAGGVAIISVLRSGASGFTWAAGATELCTAATGTFSILPAAGASMFVYGMTVKTAAGTTASSIIQLGTSLSGSATRMRLEMDTCTFDIASTGGAFIGLGSPTSGTAFAPFIRLRNCTFNRIGSNAAEYFRLQNADVEIVNPTVSFGGATKPAFLVAPGGSNCPSGSLIIRDGDLSGYSVSGGAIINLANLVTNQFLLENLKLSATPTLTGGAWVPGSGSITVRNCDSANTIYIFQYINPYGTLTADTSVFITSGGAQFNGAGASWKIVTSSLCTEFLPFVTPGIFVWDTTLSAQTASIEIIRDNATALTDRDIWSSLDSANSASFPNYTDQTNRNANPFSGTPANQPTSTATWTGTGGFGNPTKQHLTNAFTASAPGLLQAYVSVGIASTTFYIDPFIGGVS